MKKYLFLSLISMILVNLNSFSQDAGSPSSTSGWSFKDRSAFITECEKNAASIGKDSANYYCCCMLGKIEVKYPNADEAGKITDTDLDKPEFKKMIAECLAGNWTAAERKEFIDACESSAKENMSAEKAVSYCGCMIYQVEKKYPDHSKVGELTEEKLKTAEWKKLIEGCLQ